MSKLRKIKRAIKPHYTCCGNKMKYKQSHDVYVCLLCGKEKGRWKE